MTHEEYLDLFHKAQVNLVAFKPVFNCNEELRHMVEMAVEAEHKRMQEQIETLYAMYTQACDQRDALMDQQRAQVAAMRGQIQ
jgi:hypothetical protein